MVNFYDTRLGKYFRDMKYKKVFDALSPGEVAIDCGANVGKVTKRMMKPGVDVYAFEPDPAAFEELQATFKGVEGVMIFNKAVSDHFGIAKIYFSNRYKEDPKKWSTGSTLLADKPNVDPANFKEVEVVDLAEFIKSLHKPIGLLKMDIEGEEVKVLNELIDQGLTERIRYITVETHERFPALKEPTDKLRQRIKTLGISNIDLDWA